MRLFLALLILVFFRFTFATKIKSSVRKRPVAVTDPYSLRTLEDWINLGKEVLIKSCEVAALPTTGEITSLARRLKLYYDKLRQQGLTQQQQSVMRPQFGVESLSTATICSPAIVPSSVSRAYMDLTQPMPVFSLAHVNFPSPVISSVLPVNLRNNNSDDEANVDFNLVRDF